ncbi:excisionase family protein [Pseudomonas rubra]|uniref:Excisionase family protein n=1 Tax=Pseudomonas rubra TaxID=2942627 RepID=A0ABT5P921_9PSED|nr:excisionase family protein [Pseudomonas rubra]MDD1014791.1 excisionase family protein [Pseudomonas rubra]MDD1040760.1 excisionase family protein [Pseudomonas rubra]MDD1157710.1 excisionase family protein [Pseudomonas rubra]
MKNTTQTAPGAWFRQELLVPIFGISTEAARKYRTAGLWLEGTHWRRDPANRIVYNKRSIENWMEGRFE